MVDSELVKYRGLISYGINKGLHYIIHQIALRSTESHVPQFQPLPKLYLVSRYLSTASGVPKANQD